MWKLKLATILRNAISRGALRAELQTGYPPRFPSDKKVRHTWSSEGKRRVSTNLLGVIDIKTTSPIFFCGFLKL